MGDLGPAIVNNAGAIAGRLGLIGATVAGIKSGALSLQAAWTELGSTELTAEEKAELAAAAQEYLSTLKAHSRIQVNTTRAAQNLAHNGTLETVPTTPEQIVDLPTVPQPAPSDDVGAVRGHEQMVDLPSVPQPAPPDDVRVVPGHGLLFSIARATTASSATGTFGYSSARAFTPSTGATNLASVTGATLNAIVRARPPPSTSGVY